MRFRNILQTGWDLSAATYKLKAALKSDMLLRDPDHTLVVSFATFYENHLLTLHSLTVQQAVLD